MNATVPLAVCLLLTVPVAFAHHEETYGDADDWLLCRAVAENPFAGAPATPGDCVLSQHGDADSRFLP